jgi:cysteine desulfuration protein SufE
MFQLQHQPQPPITESDRRQREIADEFAFLDDWMLRFQQVIEHGETMEPLPDDARTDARLVRGCQSRVWLDAARDGATFRVRADSESQLVRGLASLLVRVYDGLPAAEAASVDLWFPAEIGLAEHLSPNRANGLDAMARAIRAAAGA